MSNRYNRQTIIPEWNQENIKSAKVLILGVGAIGSYLVTNLALAGIGKFILVDYDTIEISNLNRQLLFTEADIGRLKVEVAKEKLQLLNPDVEIVTFDKRMEDLPHSLSSGNTIIACCLDTFLGRRWANSLAIREKIPMVTGGMYAFLGNIQTIIPYETPCFECQPLISAEKLSQACTPLGEERKKLNLDKPMPKIPSVSTLSSIISGLMSQEILKIIMQVGTPIINYLFIDGLHGNITVIPLNRNDNCPICGKNYKLMKATAMIFRGEQTSDFLQRVALTFGLKDPEAMLRGKILDKTSVLICNEGDTVYIRDDRLATPIALSLSLVEP